MGINEKLLLIQTELKAPKSQFNSFGKYNYRNCGDVLEAVKPLCKKYNAVLTISDSVNLTGDRVYIVAETTLTDIDTGEKVTISAFAREPKEKKGMDDSQITGATSSYARKYALNGLFCIDDTKDSDGLPLSTEEETKTLNPEKIELLLNLAEEKKVTEAVIKSTYKVKDLSDLTEKQYTHCIAKLNNTKVQTND